MEKQVKRMKGMEKKSLEFHDIRTFEDQQKRKTR